MVFGYAGKILHIDLTTGKLKLKPLMSNFIESGLVATDLLLNIFMIN